jgi:hypothetical protein
LDALLWDIHHVPTGHIVVESSGTSVLYWMPVSCNSSLVKMQFLVHILVQHQTCCTKLSHCYQFTWHCIATFSMEFCLKQILN